MPSTSLRIRKANPSVASYAALLKAIQAEITTARRKTQETQAEAYWNVGKYISDYVLEGKDRAKYGEHIYDNLSKDLNIAKRTLEDSVRFSREYSIAHAPAQLSWTHYRALLSVKDRSRRRKLEKKVLRDNLPSRQLEAEIHQSQDSQTKDTNAPHKTHDAQRVTHNAVLSFNRGRLYTYKIIEPSSIQPVEGYKVVDCGFEVWRQVPVVHLARFDNGAIVESLKTDDGYKIRSTKRAAADLYTFKATVERVIDGDTLLVHVDCGLDCLTRQRLRFRGIDTPELSTKEGRAAKRFIESKIKPNDFVIIKTHKNDKYDRYLVDVFYSPGEKDPAKVAAEGIYLNQELLDQGLAKVWK